MGTHAAIITKQGDRYAGIYVHWDGYPDGGVGETLLRDHTTQESVDAIIALGDQSGFLQPYTARSEELNITYGPTAVGVAEQIDHSYAYLFENGEWRMIDHEFIELPGYEDCIRCWLGRPLREELLIHQAVNEADKQRLSGRPNPYVMNVPPR